MGYESLHIMEILSVQCLQVDDVIPILSSAVYCGFESCSSQRWHYFLMGVNSLVKLWHFQQGDNILSSYVKKYLPIIMYCDVCCCLHVK